MQKYNAKADIWSLGTICYEMFTGKELFQADNLEDLILKNEKGKFSIPLNKELSNEIRLYIKELMQTYKTTCIYVSHNISDALSLADHIFLINEGKLVGEYTPMEFLDTENEIAKSLKVDLSKHEEESK